MHVRYDEHLDAVYIILRYLKAALEKIYYLEREKPVLRMWLFLFMLIRQDPLHIESKLQVIVPTCGETW